MLLLPALLLLLLGPLPASLAQEAECHAFRHVPLPYTMDNPHGECSDRGECWFDEASSMNRTFCACDEGWTGETDWVVTGEDCHVNKTAVGALWGFNMLVTLVYFWRAVPLINKRYRSFFATRQHMAEQGKTYKLIHNRGLIALLSFYCVCFPAQMGMCTMKVIEAIAGFPVRERIGFTFPATFFFCAAKVGLYMGQWFFTPALLSTVLRAEQDARWIVRFNDIFSFVVCVCSISLGFLAFIALLCQHDNEEEGHFGNFRVNNILFGVYLVGMTFVMISHAASSFVVRRKVSHVLERSYSITTKARTITVKERLQKMQQEVSRQALLQSVVYFAIFMTPYLWSKHDYFLPLSWLSMPVLGFRVANTADSKTTPLLNNESKSTNELSSGRRNTLVKAISFISRKSTFSSAARQSVTVVDEHALASPNPKFLMDSPGRSSFSDTGGVVSTRFQLSPSPSPCPPMPEGDPPSIPHGSIEDEEDFDSFRL